MSIAAEVIVAVRARLHGADTYDGYVPDNPALQYCVVYADEGVLDSATIRGDSELREMEFQFRYVAPTASEVRSMTSAVRSVVMNKTFYDEDWIATFDPDHFHVTDLPRLDKTLPDRVVMTSFDSLRAQCRPNPDN